MKASFLVDTSKKNISQSEQNIIENVMIYNYVTNKNWRNYILIEDLYDNEKQNETFICMI